MSILKTVGAASAIAVLSLTSLAIAHDVDDGDRIEKSYDFTGFDEIEVEGVYDVHIKVGPEFSIETSGTSKEMERAKVSVSGDRLILGQTNGVRRSGNRKGIRAEITLPSLNSLSLQGVGSVEAEDIDAEAFTVSLEGVGSMELSGSCTELTASVEGVGSLEARDLKCEDVDVTVEGVGSAEVYASDRVNADMEGMGSIEVWGKPGVVQKSKNFMSSVEIH